MCYDPGPISQKGGFKSRYIGARKLSAGTTKPWNRNETTSVHLEVNDHFKVVAFNA